MNNEGARRSSHADGVDGPQHGRRARRSSAANTQDMAAAAAGVALDAADHGIGGSNDVVGTSLAAATHRQQQKRQDTELQANVRLVHDEVDQATRQEQLRKLHEEKEKFAQKIAEAPTSYQAAMPRLSDLDIKSSWDRLLRSIHSEYDMSCLTTCLSRKLDEDETWNPEMLLVALTSDMLDAKEAGGGDVLSPVDPQAIGLMTGGEATRKRKEKTVAGAAGGSDTGPPTAGKLAFQKRGSNKSDGSRGGDGGDGAAKPAGGTGTPSSEAGGAAPAGGRRTGGVALKSSANNSRSPPHAVTPISSTAQELSKKESKKAMKEKANESEVSRKSSKKSVKESK